MPLAGSGDALGDLIKATIDAVSDPTDRAALFHAMGEAIVAHITANAIVIVGGVTPGPGDASGGIV